MTDEPLDSTYERRVKLLYIRDRDLMDAVIRLLTKPDSRCRLVMDGSGLENTKVEGIHHDVMRRAFGVLLSHPSWPIVDDGEMPEDFNPKLIFIEEQFPDEPTVQSAQESPK